MYAHIVQVVFFSRQVGQPTDDWKSDPEGGQESAVSKAVRGVTRFASQVSIMIHG